MNFKICSVTELLWEHLLLQKFGQLCIALIQIRTSETAPLCRKNGCVFDAVCFCGRALLCCQHKLLRREMIFWDDVICLQLVMSSIQMMSSVARIPFIVHLWPCHVSMRSIFDTPPVNAIRRRSSCWLVEISKFVDLFLMGVARPHFLWLAMLQ